MLELDLLLQAFMQRDYSALEPEGRRLFAEVLLPMPDQELLELLLGAKEPGDKDVAQLVAQIRAAQD